MLISGLLNGLLRHNALPHTAARTRAVLEDLNWELFDHPPYSPDPALSDYHLCIYLKNWLRSQCFNSNDELMEGVKTWLSSQAADYLDTKSASFPAVTTLRSSEVHVCTYFLYIIIFLLLILLTANQSLLSE
jgi:transposase